MVLTMDSCESDAHFWASHFNISLSLAMDTVNSKRNSKEAMVVDLVAR